MNAEEARKHLLDLQNEVEATRPKVEAPSGWAPGVIWEGTKGTITTPTLSEPPKDWSDLLRERGLDPDLYEVVGDTIRWTSYDGWRKDAPGEEAYSCILYSFKAELRLRRPKTEDPDLVELYKEVKKSRPNKSINTNRIEEERDLIVALSDWQIGNGDAGGTRTQIEALTALPDLIADRVKQLKGTAPVNHIIIAGMGDLLEGTCGFYPSQPFLTELDRRQQTRVARRALVDIATTAAKTTPKVTVTCAGGNHGEHRQNGKRHTGFADNDDVAVFEQLTEILQQSPHTNIQYRIPTDQMAVSIHSHGNIIAFTHGHLAKPQKNAAEALWNWWKDHTMGRYYPGLADANILIAGHFHHLNIKQQEHRTVIICPSLTPVGDWYSNQAGVQTVPGTLTLTVDHTGWNNLQVLK
jgi:predicted phosphodiesterase